MTDKFRIDLLVLDLVERCELPEDIQIKRNDHTLYTGTVSRVPKELLNEHIIKICSWQYYIYTNYLRIEIE